MVITHLYFFQLGSTNILIDVGDGISKALLHQNVDHNLIDKIIISHFHSDHLAGLPSLLTQMIIAKRRKAIEIYTHKSLLKTLIRFLESSFLFIDKYDFEIKITGFENDKEINLSDELKFISKQNSHITNKRNVDIKDLEFMSVSFFVQGK
ncbi:MAG: MBL fold metallo-hydrolase [Ignavibacteriales bacterium]|nr:MBL fold metallo-hydrolase [Ignavibacteriales bacterium]